MCIVKLKNEHLNQSNIIKNHNQLKINNKEIQNIEREKKQEKNKILFFIIIYKWLFNF
jgi:hypothetical protein